LNKKPFRPFPLLRKENLLLRELNPNDKAQIFQLRTDPRVVKYIKRDLYKTHDEAKQFITHIHGKVDSGEAILWAIEYDHKLVGTICIWNISDDQTVGELGYELLPDFQGKGIMTQALNMVVDFGFKQMNLKQLEAFTHKENLSSISLLERKNFKMDPHRRDIDVPTNRIFILNSK